MEQTQTIQEPQLSRRAFWDTRLETLDFDRYDKFVVIRVLERGSTSDIREIIRYYGKDKIITIVTLADQLMPRAFIISKRLFHLTKDQYKCLNGTIQVKNYSMY
jgi:hypothetical protein